MACKEKDKRMNDSHTKKTTTTNKQTNNNNKTTSYPSYTQQMVCTKFRLY